MHESLPHFNRNEASVIEWYKEIKKNVLVTQTKEWDFKTKTAKSMCFKNDLPGDLKSVNNQSVSNRNQQTMKLFKTSVEDKLYNSFREHIDSSQIKQYLFGEVCIETKDLIEEFRNQSPVVDDWLSGLPDLLEQTSISFDDYIKGENEMKNMIMRISKKYL